VILRYHIIFVAERQEKIYMEKVIEENIGVTLGKQERLSKRAKMESRKNFVQRLNSVGSLVETYMSATHTLKWETREFKDELVVRVNGVKHRTRHMEFHGIGQRAFYVFTLPDDKMLVFSEGKAETLEVLQEIRADSQ